jgi:site-specific recombinase XerD
MSDLAPLLQGFFTDKLMRQRQASPHTIAAYRDTFKLLLCFVADRTGRGAAQLRLGDLEAPTIGAFLLHLETERGNTTTTRNARLTAIHSFFRYAALRAPDHAALIYRVLAIPPKRFDRAIVSYLTELEAEALIAAPDRTTWLGRRDHALLLTDVQTGLRVSELIGLKLRDVHLDTGPHLRAHGKGRKDRCTPLISGTVKALRAWLAERGGQDDDPVFPTSRGTPLSRDAVERLVAKYAVKAATNCPSLSEKNVTPHTMRHTTAMALLRAGVDVSVIALWLGHESTESTQVYLHADMTIKERALARITPLSSAGSGRYQAPDSLLAYLDTLGPSDRENGHPDYAAYRRMISAHHGESMHTRHNPGLGISRRSPARVHGTEG